MWNQYTNINEIAYIIFFVQGLRNSMCKFTIKYISIGTSHISSAISPHVAHGYHIGQPSFGGTIAWHCGVEKRRQRPAWNPHICLFLALTFDIEMTVNK